MSADDVSFLARSPNRAAVLSALSDAPCDRGELRERVGASRVTVGRITTDLERRGWIERTGNEYRATTAGAVVVAAYERFVDVVEAADHLEPVLDMLPVSSFDFDLAVLADSEVVAPTPTSPGHHLQRLRELFAGSNEVRMVVHAVAPRVVASCYDAARRGNHVTRGVVTPDVTEAIRADEAVREQVREMGLSSAAETLDEVVRASKVADANVAETVERRVTDLLEAGDETAFAPAPDPSADTDGRTRTAAERLDDPAGTDGSETTAGEDEADRGTDDSADGAAEATSGAEETTGGSETDAGESGADAEESEADAEASEESAEEPSTEEPPTQANADGQTSWSDYE
jgi:predicted transcriptional regulator